MITNQRGDYKAKGDYKRAGWLQHNQLTLHVPLHTKMWSWEKWKMSRAFSEEYSWLSLWFPN